MSTTQVFYDGKRIIPARLLNYSRSFNQLPNGEIIGSTYNITFTSTLIAHKGSPDSEGNFWSFDDYPPDEVVLDDSKLSSILGKQEALRGLFGQSNVGKKFEVRGADNEYSLWFFPKDIEIAFSEGPWFQTCEYSISMVADKIYPEPDGNFANLESASEIWTIEPNEQSLGLDSFVPPQTASLASTPFTYRVSHSVSAVGKKVYSDGGSGNLPYIEAKNWIASRTGVSNTVLSGFNNLNSLGAYNHVLTENIDEIAGSYSINESWLFSSGNVIEDYTVTSQGGLDGLSQVGINGNVQGLELRVLDNVSGHKWDNASGYFNNILQNNILDRAQAFSNISLNPIPISYSIGRNPLQGNISYTYEYNNRPTSLISGALSERIAVNYTNQNEKVAIVPVIGRPHGPVLQTLGTSEARSKQLSIDFNIGPQISGSYTASDFEFPYSLISGIVETLDPANLGVYKSFRGQPQENWEPLTGTASFNLEWTYEL